MGTTITNPRAISTRFVRALEAEAPRPAQFFLGIDLGGTRTKFGVVSGRGELIATGAGPMPSEGERDVLLKHLKQAAGKCAEPARQKGIRPAALGVAMAGWVDSIKGCVVFATDNLRGWTGTRIVEVLGTATRMPVAVENDANAPAVGERRFGLARGVDHFVCLTPGTGVSGGCYIDGRLNHGGGGYLANSLGHISLTQNGLPCTCGQMGCLEAYANNQALLRYAGPGAFGTAEELIAAANSGNEGAGLAVRTFAGYVASGIATLIHILDRQMIVLADRLTQNNPLLLAGTQAEVPRRVTAWRQRTRFVLSELGYHGGVFGGCAMAMDKLVSDAMTQDSAHPPGTTSHAR